MNRRRAGSARSVLLEHEEAIREVLGDADYRQLARHLSGAVRLLEKLERATLPSRRHQIKMSPALNEDARRAIEALADHLSGLPVVRHTRAMDTPDAHAERVRLRIVSRGAR